MMDTGGTGLEPGGTAGMGHRGGEWSPSHEAEGAEVVRLGFYAFLVNLVLVVIKGLLAISSGSLVITASTVDSATDAVASLAMWGGLRLSNRKSRSFPYGLYKIENVIQVSVAILIFMAGLEIVKKAFTSNARPASITIWVILGMAVSGIIPLVFSWYIIRAGRRTGSPALLAEGRHRQVDVLSTAVVLAAVISDYLGLAVDRVASLVVLAFIGYAGWELLKDGMRVLLDASLDWETLTKVREILESEPAVVEVTSLVGRNAGRYRFLEADVILRVDDLQKAYHISKRMESRIREHIPHVDRVLIHYEPRKRERATVAVPLEMDGRTISVHLGEAPYFWIGVRKESDGQVQEERLLPNPHMREEKGKGLKVGRWLIDQGVDEVVSKKGLEGKGAGYVLSDAGVDVVITDLQTVDELKGQWIRTNEGRQEAIVADS